MYNKSHQSILMALLVFVAVLQMIACSDDDPTNPGNNSPSVGTIVINQLPVVLSGAGWSLTGPHNVTGSGVTTISSAPVGPYTLTWDSVGGFITPSSESLILAANGTVTFNGTYSQIPNPGQGFIQIPPSLVSMPITFTMGSDVYEFETPHEVTLTTRFHMASTEVTNGQYVAALQWAFNQGHVTATTLVVSDNIDGSSQELLDLDYTDCQISFSGGVFSTTHPQRPVVKVTWFGAAAYCDWLSQQGGLPRAYDHSTGNSWSCNNGNPYTASGYRLPTEAEWEFACRAGTTTPFNTGICLNASTEANYDGLNPYTDCPVGPFLGHPNNVGYYLANQWGLFDMHGNVLEWCNDWGDTYHGNETNPTGGMAQYSLNRMIRGGQCCSVAVYNRSAHRTGRHPDEWFLSSGFRPVRSMQ